MNTRKFVSIVLSALLGLSLQAFAQATATEATVTDVKGKATVKLPDGSMAEVAKGMKLPQGAEITTGDASQVSVQAHEGIVAIVNSKTVVSIDELSVGANGMRNAAIGLKSGTLASALDPAKKAINNYSVRTPKGVAAARGTVYTVAYKGGNLTINVVNGVVQSLSLTGVTLASTTAGNVSTTDGNTTQTVTLSQAIASEGTALTEALATVAAAAATAGGTTEAISVVQAIASAAGTSSAATAIVSQSTAAAAAAVVYNAGTTDTSAAAQIVGAAVTSAAQAGNSAAANTIVATATTTVSAVVNFNSGNDITNTTVVSSVATSLAGGVTQAASAANVTVAVNTSTVTTTATSAVSSGSVNGVWGSATVSTSPGQTQTADTGQSTPPVITTPQPIDPSTVSGSTP